MELGAKIRSLRTDARMTQEELAEKLGVSSQAVSKWETNASTPDILLLPKLSILFGVTIDELFDLTVEEKLSRIENMFWQEAAFSDKMFQDTKEFLFEQLETYPVKGRIEGLIARLYHLRMEYDAMVVSRYARECMRKLPADRESNVEWLLQKAEGAVCMDYNIRQHHKTILFYKEQIERFPEAERNYRELMDQLLADHRITEAKEILEKYRKVKAGREQRVRIYELRIAAKEGDFALAEKYAAEMLKDYPNDSLILFELGGYQADRGHYDDALRLFEQSYNAQNSPRYVDALQAQAILYEIRKQYDKAVEMYERILQNLRDEWNTTEGVAVTQAKDEIERLKKMK